MIVVRLVTHRGDNRLKVTPAVAAGLEGMFPQEHFCSLRPASFNQDSAGIATRLGLVAIFSHLFVFRREFYAAPYH
jgi:hypothetical protein